MTTSSTSGRASSRSTTPTGGTGPCSSLATQSPALRVSPATTLLSTRSSSSTATTGSRAARDATSTRSSLTSTTPTCRLLASTCTPSRSSPSSTNLQAPATCPALITRPSSSRSPTTLLALRQAPRSVSMRQTTTCSALCLEWAGLLTQIKCETTQWFVQKIHKKHNQDS